jgi:hypothetical protein
MTPTLFAMPEALSIKTTQVQQKMLSMYLTLKQQPSGTKIACILARMSMMLPII